MLGIRRSICMMLMVLLLLPASTRAQTPEAWIDPEREIIFEIEVEGHAPPPVFVGMARLTFPPGAMIIGGAIAGPRLFLIESGSFEFVADSPATIRPQGDASHERTVASGETGSALPGDLVVVTGNPPFTVTNVDSSPSGLLDIVIWPPFREQVRPFVTEDGVIFEPLVIGEIVQFPTASVRIVLETVMLPRDTRTPYEPAGGPLLLYVGSGKLGIHSTAGEVSYSSAAANAPGSITGRVRQLAPGRDAVLTAGGAAVLHAGCSGYLQNLGRTALDLARLRFEAS